MTKRSFVGAQENQYFLINSAGKSEVGRGTERFSIQRQNITTSCYWESPGLQTLIAKFQMIDLLWPLLKSERSMYIPVQQLAIPTTDSILWKLIEIFKLFDQLKKNIFFTSVVISIKKCHALLFYFRLGESFIGEILSTQDLVWTWIPHTFMNSCTL